MTALVLCGRAEKVFVIRRTRKCNKSYCNSKVVGNLEGLICGSVRLGLSYESKFFPIWNAQLRQMWQTMLYNIRANFIGGSVCKAERTGKAC